MYKEMCKKDDFLKLMAESIKGKPNIGMLAAEGNWSSIRTVPKLIGDQIDQIIDLVQDCINNYSDARKICDKNTEGVVITEFQPVGMGEGYELYLQIVPKAKVKERHTIFAEHTGITVYPDFNKQTLLLINASQWMLYEAEKNNEPIELYEEDEEPMTYGSCKIDLTKAYTEKAQKTQAGLLAAATAVYKVSEAEVTEMKSPRSEKKAEDGKLFPLVEAYRTLPKSPQSVHRNLKVVANLTATTSPAPSPGGSFTV